MKFLENFRPSVAPVPQEEEAGFHSTQSIDPEIVRVHLRRPIIAGGLVVLILVVGLLVWAMVASVSGAVLAPGTVKVENNSKVLKSREGGVVRKIFVREGQRVRAGQPLMQFDQVQNQASVDIYQSLYDTQLAQIARFQAELAGAREIRFPADLLRRQGDPQVAALIAGQRRLFEARMAVYNSQAQVLGAQAGQIGTQIQGIQAQATSIDAQSRLVDEELRGVAQLNREGYAPKSRLLALQRGAASIRGQRGSATSEIARAQQSIGEVRLQLAQLNDRRQTDAADGLRQAQQQLADTLPKLRAVSESLDQTVIRAPVDGYVFALSQYTEGGVAQAGETLMQIVPSQAPLIINVQVRPNDITDVRVGQPARITLTAYNSRTTPQVDGHVILVSADAVEDQYNRIPPYYLAQVRVDPKSLAAAGPNVRLTPGMQAMVSIVTGERTIMNYLLAPFTDAMRTAFRER